MLSQRTLNSWEKFNAELDAFRKEKEEDFATLYEDAFTNRWVKDFKMTKTGILTWYEKETWTSKPRKEREKMMDDEDAREWLSFWKANLRRAKRYWAMDVERLDAIQDGTIEDIED
jgi:hypothetical protein